MQRVEIDRNKPLEPGDRIEMQFKTLGGTWLRYANLALIEWRLEGRFGFQIMSWRLPDEHTVIFEILIRETNPVILTAVIIGGIIIATAGIAWLTLDKVYQIIESPAGQVGFAGFGILAVVVAVVIVLGLVKK